MGIALNKFIPSLSIDIGSLIGIISLVASFYYYERIAKFVRSVIDGDDEYENEKVIVYPEKYFRLKKNRGKRKR